MAPPYSGCGTPTGGDACNLQSDLEQQLRTINLHPQTLGGRAMLWGNTATPMEHNGSSASTHGRGGWAVQCTHVTRDPPNTTGASCFLKANSNTHFYASEGGQKMGGSDDQLGDGSKL